MKRTKYQNDPLKKITDSKIRCFFEDTMEDHAAIIEYKDGESIQERSHETHFLQLILQGKGKIITTEVNGKRNIIQFISENDFIGELAFIDAEIETKDVVAIGTTLTYAIPMDQAKEHLYTNLKFMQSLSQYIGKKLLLRMDHFSRNQSYELKYRLARVIVFASVDNIYKENQSELAQYLGVSYRHLLHTMRYFKENDYLKKNDSNAFIININKLNTLIKDFENK